MAKAPTRVLKFARRKLADAVKRMGAQEAVQHLSYRPGLPPGLDSARVEAIVQQRTGGWLVAARFRHMSGWKASGAYRLVLKSSVRRTLSIIYKNAHYSDLEIPALDGLPIQPGVGEHFFFSHATGPLAAFLPEIILAEEVVPRAHYRYLMQDLSVDHRGCVGATDTMALCALLPDLQRALQAVAEGDPQVPLVRFDRSFDRQLLAYARRNLESYQAVREDSLVRRLLQEWETFSAAYARSSEFAYGLQPLVLIHGDLNRSNVLIHKRDGGVKVLDLEWAGWGLPHSDLASSLIGAPQALKAECLTLFNRRLGLHSLEVDQGLYLHAGLQRAVLNAAFVARQLLSGGDRVPAWFPDFISRSCQDAWTAHERLTATSV